jgi:ABC-type branched-subunit amino acid transport system substrate-binding protein
MVGRKMITTALVAVVLAATACGGSAKTGSGAARTYSVGLLTDITGPGASGSSVTGVQAGIVYAKHKGYDLKMYVGDTTTSPAGALAAAQKLVQQDHVDVIIAISALAFAAESYLVSQHIPVVGVAEDGPEWQKLTNWFSVYGAVHTNAVTTFAGKFLKMEGATNLGAVGYGISPSSSQAAQTAAQSARDAGLKVGYLNANFPYGSTNVAPEVIAMKNAGVDSLVATTVPNTALALISGLRQSGVNLKASLLPTGYGGDILSAGAGAVQAAQGVDFELTFEPVEVHDAATQQFQNDLKAVGVTSDPTYFEYAGYTSVGLFVEGLQRAGSNPTEASITAALQGIHNWNALGLYGGRTLDINNRANPELSPGGSCTWVVKLVGTTFQLVPGADPICGTYTGQTVSGS